jgi:RNA-directed DNA polymerase
VTHRQRMTWLAIRRWLRSPNGGWKPIAFDGIALFDLGRVSITRYRYRGNGRIPSAWPDAWIDPIPTA